MNLKAFISLLIINCFVLFSCDKANSSCDNLSKGDVCIILKNRIGKNIKSLEVKHERGKTEMTNLADNENANVTFNSPGESSYRIIVFFEDGQTIKSNGSYIEGDYRMTEIIHSDKIETKVADLY